MHPLHPSIVLSQYLNNTSPASSRSVQGMAIKFANSPPLACRDSSGQEPQYGLMTLAFQRFTAVLFFYLWQSLSEWRILLSECVLVCRRENAAA
jgi:hypothetical protein